MNRLLKFGIIMLLAVLGRAYHTSAQSIDDYNINEITRELTIIDSNDFAMSFILWMPDIYWERVLKLKAGEINSEGVMGAISQYNIFAVMRGEAGAIGNIKYKKLPEIKQNIILTDALGNRYFPVENDSLDQSVGLLFANFKPVFAKILGEYGNNINFVAFERSSEKSSKLNPKSAGRFYLKYFKKDYSYRLPVGVFLPPKYCPVDNEKYKGDWKYCPYHGVELKNEIIFDE
ncbi:MAG: hypothetical protein U9N85_01825 [Bacteroidota bacterium]|nr:hypothetical protein [Bacteroidota bacterium]